MRVCKDCIWVMSYSNGLINFRFDVEDAKAQFLNFEKRMADHDIYDEDDKYFLLREYCQVMICQPTSFTLSLETKILRACVLI